jgi:hypothetical protein
MNESVISKFIGKNVLCTTQSWFTAPNGQEYRSVFGELKGIHKDDLALGFTVNRSHANWFIEVGNMVIAGCQILYFCQTEECNLEEFDSWHTHEGVVVMSKKPSLIYNANNFNKSILNTTERVTIEEFIKRNIISKRLENILLSHDCGYNNGKWEVGDRVYTYIDEVKEHEFRKLRNAGRKSWNEFKNLT